MGRFLLGFGIGFVLGVVVVMLTRSRSGAGLRGSIGETVQGALEAARQASAAEQQKLLADFHSRLVKKEA